MTAPASARPPDLSQFGVHLARRAPWNRGEHRVEDLEHPRALFLRELPRPRRVFSDRLTNDAALRFVQTRGGALERRDGIVIERERHAYHMMQYRTIPASQPGHAGRWRRNGSASRSVAPSGSRY